MAELRVEGLTVAYRDRPPVVWEADLHLRPGRVLGLAGESGCGKSTLALAALGYLPGGMRVLSGRSLLDEADVLALASAERRELWGPRLAYVGQNAATSLNPALSIARHLLQTLALHCGLDRRAGAARAAELLDEVGFPDPAGMLARYPHELSGGQQQRVALALALGARPEVLVLDEPTTGLDVTTQARTSRLIRRLVDEHRLATLYVSHDLPLLGGLADDLAVMYAGQLVELGPAADVIAAPAQPYTRALLAAAPDPESARVPRGIPGTPPSHAVRDACAFLPRCQLATDACAAGAVALAPVGTGRLARCLHAKPLATGAVERDANDATTASANAAVLEVHDVAFEHRSRRGPVHALTGVNLRVGAGEVVGVIGESGSGKSTLLRLIAGLYRPAAGELRLGGQMLAPAVRDRTRAQRQLVQLVFQNADSSLNPRQDVAALIGRPLRLFCPDLDAAQRDVRLKELLDAVRLPHEVLGRRPGELSGGQKQRVAVARALAAEPQVLLCDEVTSSLDVSVQAAIADLILGLARSHQLAVVFVSHDLALVRSVAERAIVLQNGVVREEGSVGELLDRPQDAYTRELVAAIPRLGETRAISPASP